ncbi:MEI2-like protein 2 [Tanacetum coccineum]
MHGMRKTITELHAMLKLHEQTLLKKHVAPALLTIRAGKGASTSGIFTIELFSFPGKSWVYDTGCGIHICNTTQGFRGSRKLKLGALSLHMSNGQRVAIKAIRTYELCFPRGLVLVLHNCHFAPSITRRVISVSHLYDDGFINRFDGNAISVSRNNLVYFSAIARDGIRAIRILIAIAAFNDYEIWQMDVKSSFLNELLSKEVYMVQPEGALTPARVKRMQNVPYAWAVGSIMYAVRCTRPDVVFAQNITSRFQRNPELRVSCYTDAGYLTNADDLKSHTGYVFVLNGGVVDWKSTKQSIFATSSAEAEYIAASDVSKEAVWVRKFISGLDIFPIIEEPIKMYCDNTEAITIANKSGITKGARHYRAKVHYLREVIEFGDEVENQLGKTIKLLRSNRGGEYMSQEFLDHHKEHGIIAHRTPPYTPQHNGMSERRNRTLLDMVRSMMSQTTLPMSFWDYALECVARILNMLPTKKVEKTPYKVWIPKETMGYCFYYPPENKVFVARNVEFFKDSLIAQEAKIDEPQSDIIPIRKSTRTRNAPNHMCLNIKADEYELGDLNEPANYKAALLDPKSDKWFNAINMEMQSMKDNEV